MKTNYQKKYPIHDAVIKNDISLIKNLDLNSSLFLMRDSQNLTPLDLARFLNRKEILNCFNVEKKMIKIFFPEETEFRFINEEEFKNAFKIEYLDYLFFESYQKLKHTIFQCPWGYSNVWYETKYQKLGNEYEQEINQGSIANIRVQWIDNTIGFGLFADDDLEEGIYVGEYTGIVRDLNRFQKEETTFCFHYPTSLFSLRNKVVDSMHGGNLLRFVNHSDIPNLYSQYVVINNIIHNVFLTKTKIKKGTQLTIDYGEDYWTRRKKEVLHSE